MQSMKRDTRNRIVEEILRSPGISVSELAHRLGLAKSTISVITRKLEKERVIVRIKKGPLTLIYPRSTGNTETGFKEKVLRIGILKAAEYPFIIGFAKKIEQQLGYSIEYHVYENGLEATFDLAIGRLDLALSPMPTQFLFSILTRRIAIVAGGAFGGSGIIDSGASAERVATTMASAMETCTNMFFGKNVNELKVYVKSGEEALKLLERGEVRYAALWEPYLSLARLRGMRLITTCDQLDLRYCCTLAINLSMPSQILKTIRSAYIESVEEFSKRNYKWLDAYSRLVGLEHDIVRKSIEHYSFIPSIDVREAESILRRSGLKFLSPSTIKLAVLDF